MTHWLKKEYNWIAVLAIVTVIVEIIIVITLR